MDMKTQGPQSGGSQFSHDTGTASRFNKVAADFVCDNGVVEVRNTVFTLELLHPVYGTVRYGKVWCDKCLFTLFCAIPYSVK